MKNPTMKDVASKAGVSTATVSRYLNNSGYVSKEIGQKISEIIDDLDFVPNSIAQNLKRTETNTIGIIIPDLSNVSFMDTVKAISDVVIANNYQPIILSSDESLENENKILDVLVSKRVDGIIIASAGKNEKLLKINSTRLPIVLLDRDFCNTDENIIIDSVINDNFTGSYQMINYLISLGHKKIAILCSESNPVLINDRLRGYIKAFEDNNMEIDENYILYGNYKFESGYELTKKLIMQPLKPTAIFSVNNLMALGAVAALNEMNISIPDKMSVCAFGVFKYHTILNPDMTVINQQPIEIGTKAAELLINRIKSPKDWKPQKVVFDADIIMRNSCARPR
jgi:LacI family transcriptional regulator